MKVFLRVKLGKLHNFNFNGIFYIGLIDSRYETAVWEFRYCKIVIVRALASV